LADACGTKVSLVRVTIGTAACQFSIHYNSGYGANTQGTGALRDLRLFHARHSDFTGRASNALHQFHRIVTNATPGTEDFPFSLCHFQLSLTRDPQLIQILFDLLRQMPLQIDPSTNYRQAAPPDPRVAPDEFAQHHGGGTNRSESEWH
jgi:hypothetical protein